MTKKYNSLTTVLCDKFFNMEMRSLKLFATIPKLYPSKNCQKNYARYIANDKVVTLDSNTLTGRLLIYLKPKGDKSNLRTENINAHKLLYELKYKNPDKPKIPNHSLMHLIRSLEDQNLIKNNRDFYKVLEKVDEECCSRQDSFETKDILNFLDAYMELVPHRVTELKFYKNAIDQLFSKVDQLEGKEYMKFIFYIALMKKNAKYQKILKESLSILKNEDIKRLSSEELCIIANSAFKTSTKITNKNILAKIRSYLNDNLMLLKDPALFVTLIKCLRHNRYCDEDLLATISCALFFNKAFKLYTFQTYSHLLALYSDNLYYDEKLLEFITDKCMEEMRCLQNGKNKEIRSKDLVRFLWGMSNLNSTFLKKEDFDVIELVVLKFIESSQMDLTAVIDVFWYLWMLNYKCQKLVPLLLDQRNSLDIIPEKNSTRQKLNQLLVCIYHKDRPFFDQLNLKPRGKNNFVLSRHLKDRPYLENVFRVLNTIGKRRKMRFETTYQIPHMNIVGIVGYTKNTVKIVNIEVLDHFTTLRNGNGTPTGLMQTKMRVLECAEEALIVVKENEIEDLTEAQLEQLLEDELDLVC